VVWAVNGDDWWLHIRFGYIKRLTRWDDSAVAEFFQALRDAWDAMATHVETPLACSNKSAPGDDWNRTHMGTGLGNLPNRVGNRVAPEGGWSKPLREMEPVMAAAFWLGISSFFSGHGSFPHQLRLNELGLTGHTLDSTAIDALRNAWMEAGRIVMPEAQPPVPVPRSGTPEAWERWGLALGAHATRVLATNGSGGTGISGVLRRLTNNFTKPDTDEIIRAMGYDPDDLPGEFVYLATHPLLGPLISGAVPDGIWDAHGFENAGRVVSQT